LEFQKLKNIHSAQIIEVNQVGMSNTLYIHEHKPNENLPAQKEIVNQLLDKNNHPNSEAVLSNIPELPPSSLQSFLLHNGYTHGTVLSDYDEHFANQYFHSIFDDYRNINATNICNAATLLARTLYKLAGGNSTFQGNQSLNVDCEAANKLVLCLTKDFNCDLVKTFFNMNLTDTLDSQPSAYTSVYRTNKVLQLSAAFIRNYFFRTTNLDVGKSCETRDDCPAGPQIDCITKKCITSNVFFHEAPVNGLKIDDNDDWVLSSSTQHLSTWTESNWDKLSLQLFRMDNPVTDYIALVLGIFALIASFVAVFRLKKYFEVHYKMY